MGSLGVSSGRFSEISPIFDIYKSVGQSRSNVAPAQLSMFIINY
jgi:hypothetical protein